jgi:hydrogenase maturation protease
MAEPVVVLGLGNVLCADDGVGVAAVHALMAGWTAPGVDFVDGGTLGLALLDYLDGAAALLILDAVAADAPPGTLVRLEGDDVEAAARARLSVHQVGVADLLEAARFLGRQPARVVLLGLVPSSLGLGLARSPAVAARLPDLVAAARAELARLGHPLEPRDAEEASARYLARALGL